MLLVSESEFTNGIAEGVPMEVLQIHYTGAYVDSLPGGGGLGVYLKQVIYTSLSLWDYLYLTRIFYCNITVSILNCKFVNNSADYGGNLLLHTYAYLHSKYVRNISISTLEIRQKHFHFYS